MSVETARLAAARLALRRAETAAGLRARLVSGAGALALAADDGDGRDDGDAASATSRARVTVPGATVGGEIATDLLPVPAPLAPLFPAAGLRRGSVVQVERSTSLLLALAAAAARSGGWTALTALPDLGLEAAAEAGLALGRCVLVPRPGPEAAGVLGALVDGFDVLAVGDCRALAERDRRLLSSRLRSRGAVLLSTSPWPGTDLLLRATRQRPVGIVDGALAGQEMTVHATGRGVPEARVRVRGTAHGLVAAPPAMSDTMPEGRSMPSGSRPTLRAVS